MPSSPPFLRPSLFLPFLPLLYLLTTPPTQAFPSIFRASTQCPPKLPTTDTTHARIVGGQLSQHFVRSHIVSFHAEGCGASLISPTWVLTAAHCLVPISATATLAGSTSSNGTPLKLKAVHVHPDFDFPRNDIALIELAQPAPPDVRFFAVNANPAIPAPREFARVVGYGSTSEFHSNNVQSKLYQVDVPVVPTAQCIRAFKPLPIEINGKIDPAMHVCAGYDSGKCDSCIQDSGGPLFVYASDQTLIQVGIVSFGYGCARPAIPGGYIRVSNYIGWMRGIGAVFTVASQRNPVFLDPSTAAMPTNASRPTASPSHAPQESTPPPTTGGTVNVPAAPPLQSVVASATASESHGSDGDSSGSSTGDGGDDASPLPSSSVGGSPVSTGGAGNVMPTASVPPAIAEPPLPPGDGGGNDVGGAEDVAAEGAAQSPEAGGTDEVAAGEARHGVNVAAVVGGVVGVVTTLAIVALVVLWKWKGARGTGATASSSDSDAR